MSYAKLLRCVFLNLLSDIHPEGLQEAMDFLRQVIQPPLWSGTQKHALLVSPISPTVAL
jgi:hypothetical protein